MKGPPRRWGAGGERVKGEAMSAGKNVGLVAAGFLLGTVGVKALTSEPARKCYVQGVAGGLRLKKAYEDIVEEAKAQVDDVVAEANYLNEQRETGDADAAAAAEGAAAAAAAE